MDTNKSPSAIDNRAEKKKEFTDEITLKYFGVAHPGIRPVTQIVPFNFEKRHKLLDKKEEERIKKILEEEKKAREFRAKPVPNYIKKIANGLSPSPHRSDKSNNDSKLKEREGQAVAKEVTRLGSKAVNKASPAIQRIKSFK